MLFERIGQSLIMKDESGEKIAEVTFPEQIDNSQVWDVNHTWVHPDKRGEGLASQLVEAVDELARAEDKKLIATCPYVISWYKRHEEKSDILA